MNTPIKIDFVSDVSCPWCVVGLRSLEDAVRNLGTQVTIQIHFQPFELNPSMPAEGQDINEHLAQKYGATTEQSERNRENIRLRGEEVGFTFNMAQRGRIYNTFDAHRLLHWAEMEGHQQALKNALFTAYFTEGRNPADHEVLIDVAAQVGLPAGRAREILSSDDYATDVREREQFYLDHGINAVPAVIINDRYMIPGGQSADVYEEALVKAAAMA